MIREGAHQRIRIGRTGEQAKHGRPDGLPQRVQQRAACLPHKGDLARQDAAQRLLIVGGGIIEAVHLAEQVGHDKAGSHARAGLHGLSGG